MVQVPATRSTIPSAIIHGTAPIRHPSQNGSQSTSPSRSWRSISRPKRIIAPSITAVVLVAEVIGSIITGSLALLVDAAHMLTDAGGLTIALDALGGTYMALAAELGIDPALMHRVAVIGAGTLDSLPHNGAVVTLLAVCGSTHGKSYFDIVMVGIVGAANFGQHTGGSNVFPGRQFQFAATYRF